MRTDTTIHVFPPKCHAIDIQTQSYFSSNSIKNTPSRILRTVCPIVKAEVIRNILLETAAIFFLVNLYLKHGIG